MRYVYFIAGLVVFLSCTLSAQTVTLQWARQLDAYNDIDYYTDVICDAAANVYALGSIKKTSTEFDWLIVKYDGAGNMKWRKVFDPGTTDIPKMIQYKNGYIYATGKSKPSTYYRIYTVKIDTANGNNASGWPAQFPVSNTSPAVNYDASVVRIDGNDSVFVAGIEYNTSTPFANFEILKYTASNAATPSHISYDLFSGSKDTLADMVIDGSSNVFVTGLTTINADILWGVVKFNSSLTSATWSTSLNGPATTGYDSPKKILVLPTGNVIISGQSQNTGGFEMLVVKLSNSTGAMLDSARYSSYGTGNETVADMTLDDGKTNLFVTGSTPAPAMFYVKYDTATLTQQSRVIYGGYSNHITSKKILLDQSNNIWVTADDQDFDAYNWSDGVDINLSGWSPSGTAFAAPNFDGTYQGRVGSSGPDDHAYGMATDGANGSIYIAGSMVTSALNTGVASAVDMILLKYTTGVVFTQRAVFSPTGPTADHSPTEPGTDYKLSQNYPNPFNPVTTIQFTMKDDGPATIKIYDVVGREIQTVINNEFQTKGIHEVTFDASRLASGVYFYRLTADAGKFQQLKKMVLLK